MPYLLFKYLTKVTKEEVTKQETKTKTKTKRNNKK